MRDTDLRFSMHRWLNLDSCWSIDDVRTKEEQKRVGIFVFLIRGRIWYAQRRASLGLCMTIARSVSGAIWICLLGGVLFTAGFPAYKPLRIRRRSAERNQEPNQSVGNSSVRNEPSPSQYAPCGEARRGPQISDKRSSYPYG